MIMKQNVKNDVSKDSPYKAYTFQSEIDTSPSTSTRELKGPCSPKWPCALVLLFWNGSFVESSVLIGCYFPSDKFQLREIPATYSG